MVALPPSASAQWIIPKRGLCPEGYKAKGDFCVPGFNAREAVPAEGPCEANYEQVGGYCVDTR